MNLQRHIQGNYPGETSGRADPPSYGSTVEILGKDIFFTEEGQGPAIVYVHGNLGSHKWFSSVMKIDGFRTIALDMPNFGYSDRLDGFEISEYSRYLSAFIETLNLDKPLLVGHSLGGAVVMHTAVYKPGIPGGLLLIDSSSIKGLVTRKESYKFIEMYKSDYELLRRALSAIMPGVSDEKRIDELVESALMMNLDAYGGHADALSRFDLSGKAEKLSVPVLIVRGDRDILVTSLMAEETASVLGGEILELDGVGHSVIVEDPRRFMDILKSFI